jgi:hypothetical protein
MGRDKRRDRNAILSTDWLMGNILHGGGGGGAGGAVVK